MQTYYKGALCALFSTMALTGQAQSLRLGTEGGCRILPQKHCNADTRTLSLVLPSGSGELMFSLKTYNENQHFMPYAHQTSLAPIGYLSEYIDWNLAAQGRSLEIEKSFSVAGARFAFGLMAGRVKASLKIDAGVSAHINPIDLAIPQLNLSYHRPAQDISLAHKSWNEADSAPFALLHQQANYGIPLSPHFQLGVSEFAAMGIRTTYGGGAEISYTSEPDAELHQRSTSPCHHDMGLNSHARFAVGVGLCASRVAKDYLYDAERKAADRLATRINNTAGKAETQLNDIASRLRQPYYAFPRATADEILHFFDVENPYGRTKTALHLRASIRLTETMQINVGYRKQPDAPPTTSVGMRYTF